MNRLLNPYDAYSTSFRIFNNNVNRKDRMVEYANDRDKYIIYLFVMGKTIADIHRIVKTSYTTVRNVLAKYGIN